MKLHELLFWLSCLLLLAAGKLIHKGHPGHTNPTTNGMTTFRTTAGTNFYPAKIGDYCSGGCWTAPVCRCVPLSCACDKSCPYQCSTVPDGAEIVNNRVVSKQASPTTVGSTDTDPAPPPCAISNQTVCESEACRHKQYTWRRSKCVSYHYVHDDGATTAVLVTLLVLVLLAAIGIAVYLFIRARRKSGYSGASDNFLVIGERVS